MSQPIWYFEGFFAEMYLIIGCVWNYTLTRQLTFYYLINTKFTVMIRISYCTEMWDFSVIIILCCKWKEETPLTFVVNIFNSRI